MHVISFTLGSEVRNTKLYKSTNLSYYFINIKALCYKLSTLIGFNFRYRYIDANANKSKNLFLFFYKKSIKIIFAHLYLN